MSSYRGAAYALEVTASALMVIAALLLLLTHLHRRQLEVMQLENEDIFYSNITTGKRETSTTTTASATTAAATFQRVTYGTA